MRDDEICVRPGGICSHHSVCEGCDHLRKKEAKMDDMQKFTADMHRLIQAAKAKVDGPGRFMADMRRLIDAAKDADFVYHYRLADQVLSGGPARFDRAFVELHAALEPFRGDEK